MARTLFYINSERKLEFEIRTAILHPLITYYFFLASQFGRTSAFRIGVVQTDANSTTQKGTRSTKRESFFDRVW